MRPVPFLYTDMVLRIGQRADLGLRSIITIYPESAKPVHGLAIGTNTNTEPIVVAGVVEPGTPLHRLLRKMAEDESDLT